MMNGVTQHGVATDFPTCESQLMPAHHTMQMKHDALGNQSHCEQSSDIIHNCCDTTCTTAAAILVAPDVLIKVNTSLALFTSPKFGDVIHNPRSLERPPSA